MKADRKRAHRSFSLTFIILLTAAVLLSGCSASSAPTTSGEDNQPPSQEIIPDWLLQSMQKNVQDSFTVEKDMITMLQVKMKNSAPPQIAAYITADEQNGLFVLYEKQDGNYQEVYSKKEPVYQVQVFEHNPQKLAFTSGLGEAGLQENYFHLLAYTQNGYKEVWSDIAEQDKFSGTPPYYKVIGSISLEIGADTLVYSKYKEAYHNPGEDVKEPDEIAESIEIFEFNEAKQVFEPAS